MSIGIDITKYHGKLFDSQDGRSVDLNLDVEKWCKENLQGKVYLDYHFSDQERGHLPFVYTLEFVDSNDLEKFEEHWIKNEASRDVERSVAFQMAAERREAALRVLADLPLFVPADWKRAQMAYEEAVLNGNDRASAIRAAFVTLAYGMPDEVTIATLQK